MNHSSLIVDSGNQKGAHDASILSQERYNVSKKHNRGGNALSELRKSSKAHAVNSKKQQA